MKNISDKSEFKSIFTPQLEKLVSLFKNNNYEIRIAGGAVRDMLMGKTAADLDFASTATPTEMKNLFEKEGIRMLHKRGEEHGTITCRMDDVVNFEVTTLRVDVVCDGRRAEVQYTTNWQLDANRRDLTINSLFLDFDGNVYDYFGGLDDIEKRRVAFVGDPELRIQEDFLRILRYFRFFGRISDTNIHDTETLEAIKRNKDGLKGISAERIWTELKRIVIGRKAPEVLKCMIFECGLSEHLGLPAPENCDFRRFEEVYNAYPNNVESMTLIGCLVQSPEAIANFHTFMKLSKYEYTLGEFIASQIKNAEIHKSDISWFQNGLIDCLRPGSVTGYMKNSARTYYSQLMMSTLCDTALVDELMQWELPQFPVKGTDLLEKGIRGGPIMKDVLSQLFSIWQQSAFKLEKSELLEKALNIEKALKEARKSPPQQGSRKRKTDS